MLKSFIFRLSGTITPDGLRRRLDAAIFDKDKKRIKKIINECLATDLPELEGDIHKARNYLDILEGGAGQKKSARDIRSDLARAIKEGDKTKLDLAIRECEQMNYPELGPNLREARDTLEALGGGRGG